MSNVVKFSDFDKADECRDAISRCVSGRIAGDAIAGLTMVLAHLLADVAENDCNNCELLLRTVRTLMEGFHLHCNCDDDRISEAVN